MQDRLAARSTPSASVCSGCRADLGSAVSSSDITSCGLQRLLDTSALSSGAREENSSHDSDEL
ncbi:hypothetical protein EYF80_052952 [Liparis tanakae]|uniref:Uncharacterized protein n=1 Tax=Liparis tanakae TaxID=230148 RepID=A0A4Z2F6K2_9TELE|nr:hypothetical protein EYF80_052952 [Liparis tanakae]